MAVTNGELNVTSDIAIYAVHILTHNYGGHGCHRAKVSIVLCQKRYSAAGLQKSFRTIKYLDRNAWDDRIGGSNTLH